MRKGRFTQITRTALHRMTGDPGKLTALTKLNAAADELVNAANMLRYVAAHLDTGDLNKAALEAALARSQTAARQVEQQVHMLVE